MINISKDTFKVKGVCFGYKRLWISFSSYNLKFWDKSNIRCIRLTLTENQFLHYRG